MNTLRFLIAVALIGCDGSPPDEDDAGRVDLDSGPSEQDAGPPPLPADDICGVAAPVAILDDGMTNIQIDLGAFANDSNMACSAATPGNDAFLAIDMEAGEYWHFHLSALASNRHPTLSISDGSCRCEVISNQCEEEGDEHLAFFAESTGRFFLGIDDELGGGGLVNLSVFRPICGENGSEHGEGCDDGNTLDGDECDSHCHSELTAERNAEIEPNDNRAEANALLLGAANELEVTGNIGGPGACLYHDVFEIEIPASADLEIVALGPDSSMCRSEQLTPFNISLETPSGDIIEGTEDAFGCSTFVGDALPAGTYYVHVSLPISLAVVTSYRLRARVIEP
jgi:cysteine-rich repeat protein